VARPPKDPARQTRKEILDASLDLFAEAGFFGTSMRQIARAVGVRESALYHYFESKDAILQELFRELGPGRFRQLASSQFLDWAGKLNGKTFLLQVARTMVQEWATPRERKFARLLLAEGPRLVATGQAAPVAQFQQARGMCSQIFSALMKRKEIRTADPATMALAFLGPLLALRMVHMVMTLGPPDMRVVMAEVDRVVELFWKMARR
jgi:AcrR family transcriptional regulator